MKSLDFPLNFLKSTPFYHLLFIIGDAYDHAHHIFSKIFFFTYAPLRLSIHKFLKLKVEAAVAPSGQYGIGIFSYHKSCIFIFDFKN